MLEALAALLGGLTVFCGALGLTGALAAPGSLEQRVIRLQEAAPEQAKARQRRRQPVLKARRNSGLMGWWGPDSAMARELEQAGISLRPVEYVLLRCVLGAVLALLPLMLGMPIFVLPLAFILGFQLPRFLVQSQRRKRQAKIEAQLLEALPLLASGLRAGYGFLQALDFVARRVGQPLSWELGLTIQELQLGADFEDALGALSRRVGSADLDLVVTALVLQRQVGGNLAELLTMVERTMRERVRLRGEIKALTGQQRMSAMVIGALPFFLGGVLMLLNPDYVGLLFTRPAGLAMLGTGLCMELMGLYILRRILSIEV
ncbi:MAG: type II secretion system F family protein [Dehalococcoidia bacterium]|jgi:tight adherence protein B|nr:type II secretion system F family protein [Dehalococcoidia bacterium]MDW8009848.1 type II secretion system F family protein [Chloroflexota bacterium]WBU15417.1 type II secretion system (T2SS), protein F [uncultured bacterium]